MSVFSKLMGRIFGTNEEKAGATPAPEATAKNAPLAEGKADPVSESAPAEAAAPSAISVVDVEANLTAMAGESSEDLDWKRSIVDLLKLVGMDSSFGARKELALELGYTQAEIDSKGSAEMNIWLHKQVMTKLAENGGTVPAALLD